MTNPPRILALGEVLWDRFPDGARFGGAPANFACHAADEGAEVTMLSAVGTDHEGDKAISIFEAFGVDTSLIQRCESFPTGAVDIFLDENGHHEFVILSDAAWDHIRWNSDWMSKRNPYDAVCFGTLGQREETSRGTIRQILKVLKDQTPYRVVDINLRNPFFDDLLIRESVAMANVLKLSDEELPTVSRALGVHFDQESDCLRAILSRMQLQLIAMTRGAKGAILVSQDETISQPGVEVKVHDTVGAGDSFTAALVVGLIQNQPLKEIALHACQRAARTCSHAGAVPVRI